MKKIMGLVSSLTFLFSINAFSADVCNSIDRTADSYENELIQTVSNQASEFFKNLGETAVSPKELEFLVQCYQDSGKLRRYCMVGGKYEGNHATYSISSEGCTGDNPTGACHPYREGFVAHLVDSYDKFGNLKGCIADYRRYFRYQFHGVSFMKISNSRTGVQLGRIQFNSPRKPTGRRGSVDPYRCPSTCSSSW